MLAIFIGLCVTANEYFFVITVIIEITVEYCCCTDFYHFLVDASVSA